MASAGYRAGRDPRRRRPAGRAPPPAGGPRGPAHRRATRASWRSTATSSPASRASAATRLQAEAERILGGLGFTPEDSRRPGPRAVRGLAHAGAAGPAAAERPRRPPPRRADQPPRRRLRRVAGAVPLGLPGRRPLRQPRPGLHRRRGQPGHRDEPRVGHRVRGRLRRVRGRAGGQPRAAGGGGQPPGQAAGQDRAVHRALPLQGDQGPPGPEPGQGAGEDRAHHRPRRRDHQGQVRLRPAAPLVPGRGRAARRRHRLRRRAAGADRRGRGHRAGHAHRPDRAERGGQDHAAQGPARRAGADGGHASPSATTSRSPRFEQHQADALDGIEAGGRGVLQPACPRPPAATGAPCWAASASAATPPTGGSATCPVASAPAWRWARSWSSPTTCWCSTSPPTTSTCPAATSSRMPCGPTRAPSCWSPTTGT